MELNGQYKMQYDEQTKKLTVQPGALYVAIKEVTTENTHEGGFNKVKNYFGLSFFKNIT